MIKVINDPTPFVIKAFEELYPDLSVEIQYTPDLESAGCTTIPDNEKEIPLIDISVDIPISALPEILAHELAHVAKPDNEHDKVWKETFDIIFNRAYELYVQDYEEFQEENKE